MRKLYLLTILFLPVALLAQTRTVPSNVRVQGGYSMTAIATGLSFPTAVAYSHNRIWVSEAGLGTPPAVVEIENNLNTSTILSGDMLPSGKFLGPLTDVTFHKGWLYVTHRQMA